MSLLSENVVPDNRGKIFTTNAELKSDLEAIKQQLLTLRGVDDILVNHEKHPKELVIRTSKMVSVNDIEEQVKALGFNIIPKGIFAM